MAQLFPNQFTQTVPSVPWKLQSLFAEGGHGGPRRAAPPERVEEKAEALLHLLIRIQHHPLGGIVNQPDRQTHFQFATLRFAQDPFLQARTQNV